MWGSATHIEQSIDAGECTCTLSVNGCFVLSEKDLLFACPKSEANTARQLVEIRIATSLHLCNGACARAMVLVLVRRYSEKLYKPHTKQL